MKILYLHQYFNTPEMSGSTRSYEMARRLVSMGHEVNMVTSWREQCNKNDWFLTHNDGIKTYWLPIIYSNHMSYMDRLQAFIRFALKASVMSASISTDIVLATSTPLTIAIPGVYASRKQRVPMVFEVRDLWPTLPIAIGALRNPVLKYMAKRLELFAYRNSDAIVALSPGMRDGVIAKGYPGDRIAVIPNGSDLDRFYPNKVAGIAFRKTHGIPENAILMAYVGTFGKVNGVGYIVKLAAALKEDRRIYFLTVGDGQEYEGVKALAIARGCFGINLQMLPRIPKSEVSAVLAATDIAVSTVIPLPELEANSANKFFDGLAAGCCIAINHKGWQAELLSSSGAGFHLSASIDEAKCELTNWINNPHRIFEAGEKARKLAEEQFAIDKLSTNMEQVLLATYDRMALK